MEIKESGQSLAEFLDESPCNFLATQSIAKRLEAAGYQRLSQRDKWAVKPGDRFYVTKNDSAIFAFNIGKNAIADDGFRIITAHTDSPGFRIKPHAEITGEGGVVKLNTEVYGGPILYTWFDRPLSVAGRVLLRGTSALKPDSRIVDVKSPIMVIPHLPIHFNRSVNEGNPLSKQADMLPILASSPTRPNEAICSSALLPKNWE